MTAEQLDRFHEDGYLVVKNVLTEVDLEGIEAEYREIVERVSAELVEQGKIRPLAGTTFSEKYMEAMQQLDDMYDLYQHLDISLPLLDELDSSHTMNAGREVFRLLTNPPPARHRRVGDRTRDLLQSGAAHPHQTARPPSARDGARRQHRRDVVAPGLRRHRPRRPTAPTC